MDKNTVLEAAESKPEISIEGLNTASALSLLGSVSLFWTVLKEYYCAIDKKAAVIKSFMTSGEIKNYTIEVHSLKSTSKQIGADRVSEMAARLEQAGNQDDVRFINEHTDEMLEEYLKYKEILRPHFPDVSNTTEKKAASNEEINALLDEVSDALDDMDILIIEEVLEKFGAFEFDDVQNGYLEGLSAAAEEYDMDKCGEIIADWRRTLSE